MRWRSSPSASSPSRGSPARCRRSTSCQCAFPDAQDLRCDLLGVEMEEPLLLWPDLVEVHVVVAGVDVFLDSVCVRLRVRPERDGLGDVLLAYDRRRLLEVHGKRQFLGEIALQPDIRPPLVGRLERLFLILGPADGELAVAWLSYATPMLEVFNQVGV